ncbi:MAG: hypothetical protein ACRENH_13430 [Gemmatimonadaceae bacterium]
MLIRAQDAYGRLIYDFYREKDAMELVERDDGWITASGGPRDYFGANPCALPRSRDTLVRLLVRFTQRVARHSSRHSLAARDDDRFPRADVHRRVVQGIGLTSHG